MMQSILRNSAFGVAVLAAGFGIVPVQASDWSELVEVLHEHQPCISYRARLDGEFLVVQAKIEPGWHTFVMDNKQRSAEKLAGKQSLGVDGPTEIAAVEGLKIAGQWFQSNPKDFSKPELRWYSWGYEEGARFVAKVQRSGPGPSQIAIKGQACSGTTCKNIDVTVSVPLSGASGASPAVDLKSLIPVRAAD